ncbi:hypothetical protein AMECASPLE_008626 [Ameca splendens]|uniref:Uncharacterized protein n=1 Tax=Ameca splendens TaxID=208324 RepID=A0ABV0ZA08_9TELE
MNSDLSPMSPSPPMNSNMNFHRATSNQDTRYRTHAPEPKRHESHPHRGKPPQMSSTPETEHPHNISSTNSPAPSTPMASSPPHTAHRDGKARALCNTTPACAQKRNRANTTEHRTQNGPLTPHQDRTNSPSKSHPGLAAPTMSPQPHPILGDRATTGNTGGKPPQNGTDKAPHQTHKSPLYPIEHAHPQGPTKPCES